MKMKLLEPLQESNMSSRGGIVVVRKNIPASIRRDVYHSLLMMGWGKTIALFFAVFILLNAFFGTLYWMDSGSLLGADGSWATCFFFSVETFATIGYGHWSPGSTLSHVIVTIEAAIGVVTTAIMAGFFFAKFSRAQSKIEFTKKIILHEFEGKPTISFRIINIRENQLIDSKVHVNLLLDTLTKEGQVMRRFLDLKLVRARVPIFSMSMSLMHEIDEESPLYPMLQGEKLKGEIIVTVVGTDSTFGQTVHANQLYQLDDIVTGKRWADMVEVQSDGTRHIDYAEFDRMI